MKPVSDYYDNPPSAFWKTSPRARKTHRCYECGTTIQIGERYRCVAGIWDRQFERFTICTPCARLQDYMLEIDAPACYGALKEAIREEGLKSWIRQVRCCPAQRGCSTQTTDTVAQPVEEVARAEPG